MTQKRDTRNISSLTDRIELIEVALGVEFARYAYQVAGGMKKTTAFISVWGYSNPVMVNRNLAKVMPLVLLLKEESQQHITEQLHMDKEARLTHLLETALIARQKYEVSSEAAHGAVYLKAMACINTMTGDDSASDISRLEVITAEQFDKMTHSERTRSYKRIMAGKLQLVEPEVIEGEIIHEPEGGEPLEQ